VHHIVDSLWRPYLDRKQVKPSTRRSYDCELRVHILPALGGMLLSDVAPFTSRSCCNRGWKAARLPRRSQSGGIAPTASSHQRWTTI
jgi:hypothetical protein